jgi:hypothetical protein
MAITAFETLVLSSVTFLSQAAAHVPALAVALSANDPAVEGYCIPTHNDTVDFLRSAAKRTTGGALSPWHAV